ncbi:ActS/PrrB/RegB family redox-sensitive histidine kinase [Geminicoccaceae bacterium 1502E]|nr:ActS/PrrB/RegB family redox-sensitive histidine kinase [Geminicoccaceae bacterium 1502E]
MAFDLLRGGRGWPAPLARRLAGIGDRLRGLLMLAGFGTEDGGRVRLHTVAVMRWVAVAGQLFTILFVHFSLDIRLPLAALLPAVLLTALINIGLILTFGVAARLSERGAAVLFAYDVVQLCYLLILTGGLQNPFSILLLLPVTLAAATLGLAATVLVTGLALAGVVVLALFPGTLPWLGAALILPPLYMLAAWTALSMATILISIFAWNIAEESRRHASALAATQLALAREQQLSALGAQAAAAAHLLGSPLGTVSVIARELVRELPEESPLALEARELMEQAQRCREILATLGRRPDSDDYRPFARAPLSSLLSGIAEDFGRPDVAVEIRREVEEGAVEPELAFAPELRHALANLIDNAIQFASREVSVLVRTERSRVTVVVQDDGPGFSPDVLDWLGEPYLSTRQEKGGLGLGVFIAITLLARTGAKLHFENSGKGARVTISWPSDALAQFGEERLNERRVG